MICSASAAVCTPMPVYSSIASNCVCVDWIVVCTVAVSLLCCFFAGDEESGEVDAAPP